MVSLEDVQFSNSRIASTLPPGLVAVFVGATNGVGEATLKQFAKHALKPHVYFIGRSQEAGVRIAKECKALNAEGEFIFIKKEMSLIRNVDEVCKEIKKTAEGLHYAAALVVHCRSRFILNLLPLIQNAIHLRRVVSVFTATLEGQINMDDFQGWKLSLMAQRGHAASIVTLALEAHAKTAPEVSFIHNFPGTVKSGIARGTKGAFFSVFKVISKVVGPWVYIPTVDAGDRHVFLATSARYPAGRNGDITAGVPLGDGVPIARGTDRKAGSGVYSIDALGESAKPEVEQLLAQYRKQGMVEKVWKNIEDEFIRITTTKVE